MNAAFSIPSPLSGLVTVGGIVLLLSSASPVFAQAVAIGDTPSVTAISTAGGAEIRSQKEATSFVNNVARRGIGFLSDTNLTHDQRRQAFRNLLRDSFDLATIGRFALGKYWRVATPQQRQDYTGLFEKMVVGVYSERFEAYDGQQLQVTGARVASDTDMIVSSFVVPKNGGEKVKVDWRVRSVGGRYRVVDVIVEGVSMSVTQRSDFSSVIQRGGGDVGVLIEHLKGKS